VIRDALLALYVAPLIFAGCLSPGAPAEPDDKGKSLTVADVRRLAPGGDPWSYRFLLSYGAAAFPAYEAVLSDPKSNPREVAGVLCLLLHHPEPKGQFLPLAAPFLAHQDRGVRRSAALLVREIGTPAEGSTLVALLSDNDTFVAHLAAQALAKVGGPGEVFAMDAWLQTGTAHRGDTAIQDRVRTCRDELDARLRGFGLAPPPREKK
jgi:hypothetical protein